MRFGQSHWAAAATKLCEAITISTASTIGEAMGVGRRPSVVAPPPACRPQAVSSPSGMGRWQFHVQLGVQLGEPACMHAWCRALTTAGGRVVGWPICWAGACAGGLCAVRSGWREALLAGSCGPGAGDVVARGAHCAGSGSECVMAHCSSLPGRVAATADSSQVAVRLQSLRSDGSAQHGRTACIALVAAAGAWAPTSTCCSWRWKDQRRTKQQLRLWLQQQATRRWLTEPICYLVSTA